MIAGVGGTDIGATLFGFGATLFGFGATLFGFGATLFGFGATLLGAAALLGAALRATFLGTAFLRAVLRRALVAFFAALLLPPARFAFATGRFFALAFFFAMSVFSSRSVRLSSMRE